MDRQEPTKRELENAGQMKLELSRVEPYLSDAELYADEPTMYERELQREAWGPL